MCGGAGNGADMSVWGQGGWWDGGAVWGGGGGFKQILGTGPTRDPQTPKPE